MTKQALNPYLPLDNYIPDGEPHVCVRRAGGAGIPQAMVH